MLNWPLFSKQPNYINIYIYIYIYIYNHRSEESMHVIHALQLRYGIINMHRCYILQSTTQLVVSKTKSLFLTTTLHTAVGYLEKDRVKDI